ncbi:MAG: hypothetical protein JXJ19_08070 [Elusimicrobia bacterium]|nr:hypothetical protein [Elusimicrobiota bacterium]
MRRKCLFVCTVLIFAASLIYGARPLSTDDAGTVTPGAIEAELGYEDIEDDGSRELSLCVKHGLTNRMDLAVSVPYELKPEDGTGSAEIGIKFLLFNEKGRVPAAALTVSNVLGSSEYMINSVFTKDMGYVCIHINIGYGATGDPGEEGVTFCSAAADIPVAVRLCTAAEITMEADSDSLTDDAAGILAGLNYLLNDCTVIDAGIGMGMSNAAPDSVITAGLTYGF